VDNFIAFNITTIPQSKKLIFDSLATTSLRLSSLKDYEDSGFTIDILYKPSFPDNITNWRVFEGDEKIIYFLTNE